MGPLGPHQDGSSGEFVRCDMLDRLVMLAGRISNRDSCNVEAVATLGASKMQIVILDVRRSCRRKSLFDDATNSVKVEMPVLPC